MTAPWFLIDTDDLSILYLDERANALAHATELEMHQLLGSAKQVTVHVDAGRVWLSYPDTDGAAADAAIDAFVSFVVDTFGPRAIDAALERASSPRS